MAKALSPVARITPRSLSPKVRLMLCVHAGGRCEFDGCNRYVLENDVTLTQDVFGEAAHIVAYRKRGPRGTEGTRPDNINKIENLMLMCPVCHLEVDRNPKKYPRSALEEYKRAHEVRIRHLTGFGPNRSAVLIVKAPIGGQSVAVPLDEVIAAMAPRYPINRNPVLVDLGVIDGDGKAELQAGANVIKKRLATLFEAGGDAEKAEHVSVFALGPMPLLVFLGRQLSNKVPVSLYQRHRYPESWSWKKRGSQVKYAVREHRRGAKGRVALVLSLSGTVPYRALPQAIRNSSTVYEITLRNRTPNPTFLKRRSDLTEFGRVYQETLAKITAKHGLLKSVDLFPAVPAPIAVLCGREPLPKAHPRLRVFDYDQKRGGFNFVLEV